MDKQARKLTAPREEGAASEAGSEGGSNEESDGDEKVSLCYSLVDKYFTYIYLYFCVNESTTNASCILWKSFMIAYCYFDVL